MKEFQTNEIRNIALMGSSGSGKTSLVESMLFELVLSSAAVQWRPNTVSDYFPVEGVWLLSIYECILCTVAR